MKKLLTAVAICLATITTAQAQGISGPGIGISVKRTEPFWKTPRQGFIPMGLLFMDLTQFEKEIPLHPDPKFKLSHDEMIVEGCEAGMAHGGVSINKYTMMDCVGAAKSMTRNVMDMGMKPGQATAFAVQIACGRGMTNRGYYQADPTEAMKCGYRVFQQNYKG